MKAEDRNLMAKKIIELVGGKENITSCIHCMTRLRFTVKDQSLVKVEEVQKMDKVLGAQWSNGQFQIIIGQWVPELYKEVCEVADIKQLAALDENVDEKKKFGLGTIIDGISGCLAPAIPIVTGAGMIKVVVILTTMAGILEVGSPTHTVLSFAGEAGFYFLPVFLGAFAANKFKTSMPLGLLLGAILIAPEFNAAIAAGTALNVYGIPVYSTTYTGSIFPAIMAVFVMSYVERFFSKVIPNAVKVILVPLLTILVMLPLTFCLIGPIGSFLGIYIADGIMWLYTHLGFVGTAVLACVYPLLVITGMHGSLFPPMINALFTIGYDPIIGFSGVISNLCQGAATAAVAVKNKKERPNALSCTITAILGGVTEPAMFGINLKYRTPLIGSMIGAFCGGAVAGILKVYMYSLGGSAGIFGLAGFIGPTPSNLIYAVVALVVAMVVAFIATLFLYKPESK